MRIAARNVEIATVWAKVMLLVSLGKVFVAGAGLGLAALGVVDVASTLGVKPLVDLVAREHILDLFAFGGGFISAAISVVWRLISR